MAIQSAFTLTANEIFSTLANMIISQEVFADNIGKHQTLVEKARVDGGLYGDTKLYYATDVLKSNEWGNDAEASNLLALDRPENPKVQAIKLDQFRQIRLTIDNYLTKRGFATEGAFASFNGVMLGWIKETKSVYDGTLYNVFIGTTKATGTYEDPVTHTTVSNPYNKQEVSIDLGTTSGHPLYQLTGVEKEQMEAMLIAQGMADLFVEMGDYSRAFNDYGNLRSYAEDGIKVVWNSAYINKIRKVDTPTIFHRDGLVDKLDEDILPAKYFGDVKATDVAAASNDGSYRSLYEADFTVEGESGEPDVTYHVFPGDAIPAGCDIKANTAYQVNANIICKVFVKLPPYMSSFETGSVFFNPRSLTESHFLTWGYNSLAYLKNYPLITVKKA